MIFGRVGLQTSLGKNKLMVYTIGFIWGKLRVAENKQSDGGGVDVQGAEENQGKL